MSLKCAKVCTIKGSIVVSGNCGRVTSLNALGEPAEAAEHTGCSSLMAPADGGGSQSFTRCSATEAGQPYLPSVGTDNIDNQLFF